MLCVNSGLCTKFSPSKPANATNRAGFPLSCCPFAAVQGQYTCLRHPVHPASGPALLHFRTDTASGHQPPEVAHRADDLLRDTLFSLLLPHCQYNPLFLYACAVVQRVCKLKAFDPGIGPGVTAVLFRNHKILPPIADRPRFVDISHAL